MKVLVLGAGGLAGHVVALHLREKGYKVTTLTAKNPLDEKTHLLDVTQKEDFIKFLDNDSFDVVINCIGLLVNQSEEQKDLAVYLNAYLPRLLENYYKNSHTKVIHIGTNAVFSGDKTTYREDSSYDGESFYGRTKALGDINNSKDITLRTSIVGPDRYKSAKGLFNWFCTQKGKVHGYTNVRWNGITTLELAKATDEVIQQNIAGVYHLVPREDAISKFQLLQLFKKTFNLKDIDVSPAQGSALNATIINTREDFKYTVPNYESMFQEMKAWVDSHPELYKHYGEISK